MIRLAKMQDKFYILVFLLVKDFNSSPLNRLHMLLEIISMTLKLLYFIRTS